MKDEQYCILSESESEEEYIRCRVDYKSAPTSHNRVTLQIVGKFSNSWQIPKNFVLQN